MKHLPMRPMPLARRFAAVLPISLWLSLWPSASALAQPPSPTIEPIADPGMQHTWQDDDFTPTDDDDNEDNADDEDDFEFGADVVGPRPVPAGATEDPTPPPEFDARPAGTAEETQTRGPIIARGPRGYPIPLVWRPITLPAGMVEATGDTSVIVDPTQLIGIARVRYGVIDRAEVGVRYVPGALDDDGSVPGKTAVLDVQAAILPWLSAQLALPFYIDPFAMGLTLGVPVRLPVAGRWAIFFGRDLLNIKLVDFFPELDRPRANEDRVDQLDVGTIQEDGDLRLLGGVDYQFLPNLAITGEIGVIARDFELNGAPVPLRAAVTYTPLGMLDVGARLGFADIGDGGSFGLSAFAAFRL